MAEVTGIRGQILRVAPTDRDSGGGSGEIPKPQNATFLQAKREVDRFSGVTNKTPGQVALEREYKGRMNGLIGEVDADGGLQDIKDQLRLFGLSLTNLQIMQQTGELKGEHVNVVIQEVQRSFRGAKGITDEEPKGDLYTGAREYYFKQQLTRIGNGLSGLRPAGQTASNDLAAAFRKGMSGALSERSLEPKQQYQEYLNIERWANSSYEVKPEFPPAFYIAMTGEVYISDIKEKVSNREIFNIRTELLRAANYKREKGWTMEALAANADLAGISKTEMAILYNISGVKEALEAYVYLCINNARIPGRNFSLLEARDRGQVDVYRKHIEARLFDILSAREGAEKVDNPKLRAKDAEQIAFNLLYIGNTFESIDSIWRENRRIRRPNAKAGELVNIPIKVAMAPMDFLVDQSLKAESERGDVGAFGLWAANQIQKSLKGRRVDAVDEVVLVPEDESHVGNFWKMERYTDDREGPKTRLYAPSCYPVRLLKSVWEETELGGRTLLDYLKNKERIPWGEPESQGLWSDYLLLILKSGVIWDYFQGKKPLVLRPEQGGHRDWVVDVNNVLAKLGIRGETSIKRWILYASQGVDPQKREPKIIAAKTSIRLIMGNRGLQYLKDGELFFPWDQENLFFKLA